MTWPMFLILLSPLWGVVAELAQLGQAIRPDDSRGHDPHVLRAISAGLALAGVVWLLLW